VNKNDQWITVSRCLIDTMILVQLLTVFLQLYFLVFAAEGNDGIMLARGSNLQQVRAALSVKH